MQPEDDNNTPVDRGYAGLYTKSDPTSLSLNSQGFAPLIRCSNVDIDDKGRLTVRFGHDLIIAQTIGTIHSTFGSVYLNVMVFCEGDALSLFRLSDGTTLRLRNVTPERRMEYHMDNGLIYYTNGVEQGVIDIAQQTTRDWQIETTYHGPVTSRVFSNPPLASLIHKYNGRMYVAVGKMMYISEPFDNARFVLDEGNIMFDDDIVMITSTDDSLIVGTTTETICHAGAGPQDFKPLTIMNAPAINGTQQQVFPSNLSLEGKDLGVIFTTTKGILYVANDKIVVKLTEDRIDLPKIANLQGTSIIKNGKYMCQFDTVN